MRSIALTLAAALFASPATAWQAGAGYLELSDRLDRPEDGYCLDLPGSGDWVDFTVPLNAHNCKLPGLYADEAVTFSGAGAIVFPAYKGCVTAVGLNGASLPGAPVMLRPCASDIDTSGAPFIDAGLQDFTHRDDGRIEMTGSGLCLTVGDVSAPTFSPAHRWRSLVLDECDQAPLALSVWNRFAPK